jgi:hypothetical protein
MLKICLSLVHNIDFTGEGGRVFKGLLTKIVFFMKMEKRGKL